MLSRTLLVMLVALIAVAGAVAAPTVLKPGDALTVKGILEIKTVFGRDEAWLARPAPACSMEHGGQIVPLDGMYLGSDLEQNLAKFAKLLGRGVTVEATGKWGTFDTQNGQVVTYFLGLHLGNLSLRGHKLPDIAPPIARYIGLAKSAAIAKAQETTPGATVLDATCTDKGALLFTVSVRLRSPEGNEIVKVYAYDGASAELK
jgi:hypothetical protein